MKRFLLLLIAILAISIGAASCSKMNQITGPQVTATTVQNDTTASIHKPGVEPAASTAVQNWWRSISQEQRNATILNQAVGDYNTLCSQQGTSTPYCGLQCKPWAQQEVYRATQGLVWLPQTNKDNSTWAYSPYVAPVGYGPAGVPIEGARAGHIVQMVWNGGPHTAFVHHTDSNGMYWLDSNFHIPFDNRVRIHYIKYADFYTYCSGYMVYQVIGG